MKRYTALIFGLGLFAGMSQGCQPETPEPVRCVCNCDNPPPEGTVVTVNPAEAEPAAAPVAVAPKVVPAPAPKAPEARPVAKRPTPPSRPVAEAPGRRPAPPSVRPPAGARAAGKVSAEPGSGSPVTLTDKDKSEMATVLKEFSNAAGARNLAGMQKWTTKRLGSSLESAVERHTERLFRRTDIFTKGAPTGVTVGQVTNSGGGNHSVEFKFGNGESVNLMLFQEEGNWRLNRL